MNLIHSEQIVRDRKEHNIYYASRNIAQIYNIYAVDAAIVPLGVIQWNGRQVVIDCSDIPEDIPVYITYMTDDSRHTADIIPLGRMVEEVFNKFGGRDICPMTDRFVKERLVYYINYLNRTKINQYYNKQFCFQKVVDDIKPCVCLEKTCCGCSTAKIEQIKWSCGCTGEKHNEEACGFTEPVKIEVQPRFKIPKNAPHSWFLRLESGEFVEYTQNEDGIQLNWQRNIEDIGKNYTIGYWIPTNDILSVSVDGKATSKYELHNQHIFLKDTTSCNVCIEYVDRYSECNIDDLCVVFDNSFWKLPVYETIVELAIDTDDTRANVWSQQLQQMKKEYTIIINKTNADFNQKLDKITNIPRLYNSHRKSFVSTYAQRNAQYSKWCKNCR